MFQSCHQVCIGTIRIEQPSSNYVILNLHLHKHTNFLTIVCSILNMDAPIDISSNLITHITPPVKEPHVDVKSHVAPQVVDDPTNAKVEVSPWIDNPFDNIKVDIQPPINNPYSNAKVKVPHSADNLSINVKCEVPPPIDNPSDNVKGKVPHQVDNSSADYSSSMVNICSWTYLNFSLKTK